MNEDNSIYRNLICTKSTSWKKVWRALFYLFDLFTTYYYENLWNHYLFLITYQNWICFVDEIISSWKYVKNSSLKNRNEFQISTNFFTFQSESFADLLVLVFFFCKNYQLFKAHIFWEGQKILWNLHLTFVLGSTSQKSGEDFAKFCGLLRIY